MQDIRTLVRPIMAWTGYTIAAIVCISAVDCGMISFQVALGVWMAPAAVYLTSRTIEKAKDVKKK